MLQAVEVFGLGGVGKTTLTEDLLSASSFLSDVKGKSHLFNLHSNLVKSLTGSDPLRGTIGEGIEKLKNSLWPFHALVILDD